MRPRGVVRGRTSRSWIALPLVLLCALPAVAQEPDTARIPSGVRLGMIYQTRYRPGLAVRPLDSDPELAGTAERIEAILRRDLAYSDRYEMSELPPVLSRGPVDYDLWNGMGVVYLVTGRVNPAGDGELMLRIVLHDVVYSRIREIEAFQLPAEGSPEFGMAVHAVSDRIVRWTSGEPGMAASRILFARRRPGRGHELMMVDADGENLRSLAESDGILLSPTWSPEGRRIAYAMGDDEGWRIIERDVASGETRVLTHRPGLNYTPAYSPDGGRLAFGTTAGPGTAIYEMDVVRRCCLERLTRSARDDLSPTYSPDGRRIAFNSNRLGQPHIYVMVRDGGDPELLSPFVYGEPGFYTSPDWAPTGSLVAFHGRSRGRFQIMVADAARPGADVRQVTTQGENEDPSWAPDGRHLVFSTTRAAGAGLYVLDVVTGRLRPLVLGAAYVVPDWSPTLVRASDALVDGGR